MQKYGFGVDVGGTTCKLGLFTEGGELLEKWEIPTDTSNGGGAIPGDIAATIEEKLKQRGIAKSNVLGVGVGVPGPVLADGTVKKCVNLGWGVFNVAKVLEDLLQLPVKAGNDANVAALGEMWMGGGRGYQNLVMVTLGTGVGGGIVLGGQILSGTNGAGGELGHMKINDAETDICGCGGHGCLEQYVSATGIVRMAKKRLASDDTPSVLRSADPLTAKAVADAAKAGDALAMEQMEQVGKNLGFAMANVACVVDPEIVVIGGGVSRAGQMLIDAVARNFRTRAFHACADTKFALATLGNDAGIYGCMKLVLGMRG